MIELYRHDDVLEILLDAPPVNALDAATRQGVLHALKEAQADPDVKAIVMHGAGKHFSAGADIAEFGKAISGPGLPEVVNAVEACKKPVIAALHGTCFGGGLEIALACHYRIATSGARLCLPEVKLGLLPGAGGTQRLPRLVGVRNALKMIVLGDPVSAAEALHSGLVDNLTVESTLVQDAVAYARRVTDVRLTGQRGVDAEPGIFEEFAAENARRIKGLHAPAACIEAIKAAVELPLLRGLEVERRLFFELMQGEQSRALRHVFFAERAAAKVPGLPASTQLCPISKVGVIGAGTMGGGIAMNFLSVGIPVVLVETAQPALDRGVDVMRRNYEASAAKGRILSEQVLGAMTLLTPTLDFGALAACDLVIEAVYENMELKLDIFKRLSAVAKPEAILASNTSYLDVDRIADVTGRPEDVLGMHFFSPANVMRLVEVVRGAKTAPDALAAALDLARRIKKVPVVSGVCYGFIGNRMLIPRQKQAIALLLDGASPQQIDQVHTEFGMPMGPFQMTDLAGVDIGWHRDPTRIETIKDALCAEGRWGQKTKAGFYDYDDQRRPSASEATSKTLTSFRERTGRTSRPISEEEIVVRTLYTMINEGAKILEEGIAQRASDIDVVWIFGYGWPAAKGGPMFWADTLGLDTVLDGLDRYREHLGSDFSISTLLRERAASGGKLDREHAVAASAKKPERVGQALGR